MVGSEFFGVAVPEFYVTILAILDDAAGIVVLELGEPAYFAEEFGVGSGDGVL